MKEQSPAITQIKREWEYFGDHYVQHDTTAQTFYLTLVSLLELPTARHILEVGCGRCLFLPHAVDLKLPQATYMATDLSPKMIGFARERLTLSLQRFGSKYTLPEWCSKNNVIVKEADGEQPFSAGYKFDRIIVNLVLNLTADPEKMLRNLYNQASSGCLLGASVWGDEEHNQFYPALFRIARKVLKLPSSGYRSNSYLNNVTNQIAEKVGWEVVMKWDQVGMFPFRDKSGVEEWARLVSSAMISDRTKRDQVLSEFGKHMDDLLKVRKQPLHFPVQLYIFRKP